MTKIKFYNTLSHKKEFFKPLKDRKVGLYTCGPTVYFYAHIGNLRTYLFEDILKRVLEYNGYKVKHVMNITDVGHLTSDADTGEDKLEKGARKERKSVWEIADFYTKQFKEDLKALNIKKPDVWIRATKTIKQQIDLIKILESKGFTYRINDGIYFDSSKIKGYNQLLCKKKANLKAGARVKMVKGKKHPTDFALWKFSPKGKKRQMEWDSPWQKGFPGWHTECVVMSIKELGIPFDIHCGGIDHIPIHHTNEIAQAKAAYGKMLARYWLHGEFLVLEKARMGKSEGNIITLNDLTKRGFLPLAFRYLCLMAHYRSKLTFSWQSLKAAQNSLNNFYKKALEFKSAIATGKNTLYRDKISKSNKYKKEFLTEINDDLNMPKALALAWKVIEDKTCPKREKYRILLDFDKVFGLGINSLKMGKIPDKIKKLVQKREKYRKEKKWEKADLIRKEIEKTGYKIEDTKNGPKVAKISYF
ncbi:cysteine--tRNA ligase [bacterium]|nr:cysteine--tRNA ligase [bacterium]